MRRTELLQEIRMMRFEEIYEIWIEKRLTQEDDGTDVMCQLKDIQMVYRPLRRIWIGKS